MKKGDIVTIKKGSTIRSCNPSKLEYTLSRRQKVKVHSTSDYEKTFTWVGTGKYWCWTKMSNAEEG